MINWSPTGNNPPFANSKNWRAAQKELSSWGLIGSNQIHVTGISYHPDDTPTSWDWECDFDLARDAKEMWDELLNEIDYINWDSRKSKGLGTKWNRQFTVTTYSDENYKKAEKQLKRFQSYVKEEINEILYEFDLEIEPSEIKVLRLNAGHDQENNTRHRDEPEWIFYKWADYEIQINIDELRDINDD